MPKKNSSWGVNTKAAEANERKAEKKHQDQTQKEKAIEDAKWKDDDKLDQRKKDRKDTVEQKRSEAVARKEEAKRLLAEEESGGSASTASKGGKPGTGGGRGGGGGGSKVTLSEIDKIKEQERKRVDQRKREKENERRKITEAPELETENPNRAMAELLAEEGAVEARSVGDALGVLSVSGDGPAVDMHPEKRMKAAYNDYVERELPILKAENPGLRLSQLKQMLFKQWQKHPDNPMNMDR